MWQRSRGIQPKEDTTNGCSNTRLGKQREITSTDVLEYTPDTDISDTVTTTKEDTNRWVRNLSSTPLTQVQVSFLLHGPNFPLLLPDTPHGEYITAIEQACLKLEPHNAEELRATMRGALRNSQEPTSNITKQEVQALDDTSRKTNQESYLQQTKG